jgi:hypothetical protein
MQAWTFLRLIWGEWASRVTGSLSAFLVLFGLGVSTAGAFGASIPGASILQVASWIFAAMCGVLAAHSVWRKENRARETAEARLTDILSPRLQFAREIRKKAAAVDIGRTRLSETLAYRKKW